MSASFKMPCIIRAEITDTFSGEANYAWVKRTSFTYPHEKPISEREIVRRVKHEFGYTNVRCTRESDGETITLRPIGQCVVIFISLV